MIRCQANAAHRPEWAVARMLQVAHGDADHLFEWLPSDHCNAGKDAIVRPGLLDSLEDRLDVLCSVGGCSGVCCCHIGSLKIADKKRAAVPLTRNCRSEGTREGKSLDQWRTGKSG